MKRPVRVLFHIHTAVTNFKKKKSIYIVSVHAAEAHRGGRDKLHSCLTSMLYEGSVNTFMAMKGFYRGGERKLCPSCGNCMMRLTLDVAI